MSLENPKPIPEKNELPLNISKSEPMSHQGLESMVWKVEARNKNNGEEQLALKQSRKEEFANEAEMKKSREFYNFIKQDPEFGKFVPDTLHFKARETAESRPHAYKLQKTIEGKRIDELTDKELYSDETVAKQLLEFVGAAIGIFKKAEEAKTHTPDLYGEKALANYLFNPRYSSNIIIADKPDEKGRRVFFVDVSPQIQQLSGVGREFQKQIGSKLQVARLNGWKKEIEKRISEENNQ